jgi:DNA-binding XRE family transcriptional regulator
MNIKEIVIRARAITNKNSEQMQMAPFQDTVAWLGYLGLLGHNKIQPKRCRVTLNNAVEAGALEPRIFELLPAIIAKLPQALVHTGEDIPDDLRAAVEAINFGGEVPDFRGIPGAKCAHWATAQCLDVAERKLNFRTTPRKVKGKQKGKNTSIGSIIIEGRSSMALTQRQLAENFNVSLRVIRDLEQGKTTASIKSANSILEIFGRRISAI